MTITNGAWRGTAVVTGAGSGLGSAMVERFAGLGMSIVALDIDGARAEATAEAVRDTGGQAIGMRVDVSHRATLDAAAEAARSAFGGCIVLCANVGVQQFGAVDKIREAEWRWMLDVNVLGAVNTVTAFLPLIRQAEGPRRILLTASSAVLAPGVRLGAYTTSKFAVMGLGETLRMELADEGIGVAVFFPAGMSSRHLESSALAKPAAIGGAIMGVDDIEVMMASRSMDTAEHMVTPEHATRNLLTELRADPPLHRQPRELPKRVGRALRGHPGRLRPRRSQLGPGLAPILHEPARLGTCRPWRTPTRTARPSAGRGSRAGPVCSMQRGA